jgi:serine/threonine protein kinase/Tfp pilus assembly protein PilF
MADVQVPDLVRFGPFELDLATADLHQNGGKIRLPEQQFQILEMLLRGEGKLVQREEIRKRLWPNDTVVEFDRSINAAIKKLRAALGDSADEPRFIETVVRRGYRIMVEVHFPETAAPPDTSRKAASGSLVGQRVSHYRVLTLLGGGGMGLVYKAEDLKLNRPVALKFLPEEMASDSLAIQRFEREAKAASALNHPNICTIYGVEEHGTQPFIVMEFLEGESLRELISRYAAPEGKGSSPLPLDRILEIAIQIAEGLKAAHEKGIIHRDIKPANVFVTTRGQVKILDFGLAKVAETASQSASDYDPRVDHSEDDAGPRPEVPIDHLLTKTGITMGTAAYMSPEQVRGERLDARTDLFSFGLILYEMVTGRRAFGGETPAEMEAAILHATPVPVRELNPLAPVGLARLISRFLEKDRNLRCQDVSEIRADLLLVERTIDSAQINTTEAIGQSGVARVWPLLRRRALMSIGAVSLAVLVAGFSFFWLRWHVSKRTIASIAVLPFVNAENDSDVDYLSNGLTNSLISSLAHIPYLRVMARDSAFRYKGRQVDPRKVGRDLDVAAVVTGRVTRHADKLDVQIDLVNTTNDAELWGQRYTRDRADILELQDDIAWDLSQRLRPRLSGEEKQQITRHYTENAEAYQLYLKGLYFADKFDQEDIERGLGFFRRAIQLDPKYALAYAGLSYAYQLNNDVWVSPREIMPRAKEAARKSVELDDTLAEAHNELACVHFWYDWDLEAAGREYRRAVELDPNWSFNQIFYAWYLLAGAHFEEAIAKGRQALKLDPLSPIVGDNFAWVLIFSRRYDEALVQAQQALELYPDDWFAHAMLGIAYIQKGQPGLAIADLQKAHYQAEANTQVLAELARAYFLADRKTEGRRVLSQLEQQWQKKHVGAYNIATIYAAMRDKKQAFAWLERAIEDRSFSLITLKADPEMDSLHADPRFDAVLSRI